MLWSITALLANLKASVHKLAPGHPMPLDTGWSLLLVLLFFSICWVNSFTSIGLTQISSYHREDLLQGCFITCERPTTPWSVQIVLGQHQNCSWTSVLSWPLDFRAYLTHMRVLNDDIPWIHVQFIRIFATRASDPFSVYWLQEFSFSVTCDLHTGQRYLLTSEWGPVLVKPTPCTNQL